MARVRVDALHEGMELASDVLSNTGQVLVRSGTELSEREIRLFNMWGISDIEIEGDDPGLTARLLRLVNSAFYGFPSKIESVTQALSVVGTSQLNDLALATSVLRVFKGVPKEFVDMDSFWRRARVLAAQRRESNVERLFVAGLLHDLGRLILYQQHGEAAATAFHRSTESGELLYDVERDIMGYDHAAVGRALLREWKLPESLQEPVGYHHQPGKAKRFPVEAAIVHVADITAHALQLGHNGERHVPPLSEVAWSTLGLREGFTFGMLDEIMRQYDAGVQAMLQAGE